MKDKELRKLIGSRAKQRRLELNLTQPYVEYGRFFISFVSAYSFCMFR